MREQKGLPDVKIKKKRLNVSILIITFLVLGLLTTGQMFILGKYIDYKNISNNYFITVTVYWLIAALIYTFITNFEIKRKYEKPMMGFAVATKKVADGDFSVYVAPLHRTDKMDYLDKMFLDFNKMVEELGSIETLKTDFISNVSHEIKTPIAIIQNYAEALQDEKLSLEKRKEYVLIIEESTKRLAGLITNILKLNKIENQRIQPITEPYNLCRQLCDCALQFEDAWERKNIDFIADIEDCAMISAEASLMELVWNNLLSNAFKFTEPGGSVSLNQTSTEEDIIVTVTDSGCGMSKEDIKHIFDKFYQGDSSHATEGNGLGLALTLRVLQLTGGSITVKSTLGQGSIFTVRIPVALNVGQEQ